MSNKECPICYEKLGKIYKELPCGHRYHFSCIKIYENLKKDKDLNCSYCREIYDNMKLRERKPKLTVEQEIKKNKFINAIKTSLIEVQETSNKNKKLIISNNIFQLIISEMKMLNNKNFQFENFLITVKGKLNELSSDVDNALIDGLISNKQYKIFYTNKNKIEQQVNL